MRAGLRYFKLLYIIAILFLIAFISCSKDSDEIIANDDENIILDYSVHPVTENLKCGFSKKRFDEEFENAE